MLNIFLYLNLCSCLSDLSILGTCVILIMKSCATFDWFIQNCINLGPHVSQECFVCFVALRPKSTAMVMAGRSVLLTTLFPGQA